MDYGYFKKKFGARLKELREKKGISQEQLAQLVDLESRHISRMETGGSFTTLENISKISKALGVEMQLLFAFDHKNDSDLIAKKINRIVKTSDKKQLEMIYKVILAIVN